MATKPQASGTSCWPTVLCVLIVIVLSDLAIPHQAAFAQDAKQTFIDQKSAGADFTLQGEYVGWVLTGSQDLRPIGLQVIALGGGKFEAVEYSGGLPGAGARGPARVRIPGERRGHSVHFQNGPLRIDVGNDHAIFFLESYDGVIANLNRVHRVSTTMGARPPRGAVELFNGHPTQLLKDARLTKSGLLMEGTETIAFFVLLCLLPGWFAPLAWIFASLCFITAFSRLLLAREVFSASLNQTHPQEPRTPS